MINPLNNHALIIDWDLAKYMDTDPGLESHQSGRSVSTSDATGHCVSDRNLAAGYLAVQVGQAATASKKA